MAEEPWSDKELAGYAVIHCMTDRALFHKSHVIQLHKMAGISLQEDLLNEFEEMHGDVVFPLIDDWMIRNDRYNKVGA